MKRVALFLFGALCTYSASARAQGPFEAAPPPPAAPAPPPAAPASPAVAPSGEAPPPKPEAKSLRPQLVVGIEGNRRVLYSIPFWGVGPTIGASLRPNDAFAVGLMLEHLRGESDLGLDAYLSRFRVPLQGIPADWLRLGAALGVSYLQINRATNSSNIQRVGFLIGLEATFDANVTDDVTLFLNGRAEMELLWGGAAMPGGTLGVGVRL